MSMPVLTYSCSGCDLTAWDAMLWGYRYYLVGHEEYPMYGGMGWCPCEALVPSENRPDAETEAHLAHESERLTWALDAQRREDGLARRWWQLSRRDSAQASQFKYQLTDTQEALEWVRTLRALLCERVSGNRCLRCGSENTFLLPKIPVALDFFDDDSSPPIELGCRHPQCGGELMVQSTGLRLSIKTTSRAYDLEGRRLEAE